MGEITIRQPQGSDAQFQGAAPTKSRRGFDGRSSLEHLWTDSCMQSPHSCSKPQQSGGMLNDMEHWDNLQETARPNLSGHSMIDGPTEPRDLDKTYANKELVRFRR
jgi:hypothetical protein